MKLLRNVISILLGALLVGGTVWFLQLRQSGFEAVGPIVGMALVIFSLFGELPAWLSWTTRLGSSLYPGVAFVTIVLLLPLFLPTNNHQSSFFAFSPNVWAAYLSIVFVGISFETSLLPKKVYNLCQWLRVEPYLLIPGYVIVAGLLGNIFDGVSIVIISSVILLNLLPHKWALRALFTLLFGGLISNLITVAAEPTNIKFQDTLQPILDTAHPSFWLTNWPICLLGILVPALWLGFLMKKEGVRWKTNEPTTIHALGKVHEGKGVADVIVATTAMVLLAGGVVTHAALDSIPLWILLLPAGVAATLHLLVTNTTEGAVKHLKEQSPVWIKLIVIFSLLWFLQHGLVNTTSVLNGFFVLPAALQYGAMIMLSLASAVTDNVALAAMQGSLIAAHSLAIWQVRLLLILLTWAGGLTPFGCLQSLSINHRMKLSTGAWLKETPVWAGLALVGGLIGLALISVLYPTAVGFP